MKLTKDQKRFGLVLLALLLLYYFYVKGNKAKAQMLQNTLGGGIDPAILEANADTPYPDNPTLICCNSMGQMVSMIPGTTACSGRNSYPVNGVCGGDSYSGSGRPSFSTVQAPSR